MIMRIVRNILLLVLALFVGAAFGQTVTSPDGNPITSVAIAPNGTIYCATANSRYMYFLYQSSDGGVNWSSIQGSSDKPTPSRQLTLAMSSDTLLVYNWWPGCLSKYGPVKDSVTYAWFNYEPGIMILSTPFFAVYGDTIVTSSYYYGDYGALTVSTDAGYTFVVDTSEDSLVYSYTGNTGGQITASTGLARVSSGLFYAVQGGVFFTKDFKRWDILPIDSVLLDSGKTYIYNGDTLKATGVNKLVNIGDTVFVFLNVDTASAASKTMKGRIDKVNTLNAGTLVWAITTPDSVGAPVSASRFPDSMTAVATMKTPVASSMQKGAYGVSSYKYDRTVVFGTGSGKVIIEKSTVTGIESPPVQQPASFTLSQNYPNPFNPTTQVNYSIPKSGIVSVIVYNTLGQRVATLFSGRASAGEHTVTFNADRFASGVYFCRMEAGGFSKTVKIMLLK